MKTKSKQNKIFLMCILSSTRLLYYFVKGLSYTTLLRQVSLVVLVPSGNKKKKTNNSNIPLKILPSVPGAVLKLQPILDLDRQNTSQLRSWYGLVTLMTFVLVQVLYFTNSRRFFHTDNCWLNNQVRKWFYVHYFFISSHYSLNKRPPLPNPN